MFSNRLEHSKARKVEIFLPSLAQCAVNNGDRCHEFSDFSVHGKKPIFFQRKLLQRQTRFQEKLNKKTLYKIFVKSLHQNRLLAEPLSLTLHQSQSTRVPFAIHSFQNRSEKNRSLGKDSIAANQRSFHGCGSVSLLF